MSIDQLKTTLSVHFTPETSKVHDCCFTTPVTAIRIKNWCLTLTKGSLLQHLWHYIECEINSDVMLITETLRLIICQVTECVNNTAIVTALHGICDHFCCYVLHRMCD